MAWSVPRTWTDGEIVFNNYFNTQIRDDLQAQAPAVVTAVAQLPYSAGSNLMAATPSGTTYQVPRLAAGGASLELVEGNTLYPNYVNFMAYAPWDNANGFIRQANLTKPWGGEVLSNPVAQGNYIEWPVVLSKGTWRVTISHDEFTNYGIMTLSMDGVTVGTIDAYNVSSAVSKRTTVSGVIVATPGKKVFRVAILTKNASSSNYSCGMQEITFRRTA